MISLRSLLDEGSNDWFIGQLIDKLSAHTDCVLSYLLISDEHLNYQDLLPINIIVLLNFV